MREDLLQDILALKCFLREAHVCGYSGLYTTGRCVSQPTCYTFLACLTKVEVGVAEVGDNEVWGPGESYAW